MRVQLAGAHLVGFWFATACLACAHPVFATVRSLRMRPIARVVTAPRFFALLIPLITSAFCLTSLSVSANVAISGSATRSGLGSGHLYSCSASPEEVQRYPIVREILQPKPDRTYGTVACPIAIGPDGNLVATNGNIVRFYDSDGGIQRSLIVDPPKGFRHVTLFGITVDTRGYLYATYDADGSISGVRVYGPNATGHVRALFDFLRNGIATPQALALGPGTQLYIPQGPDILVWASLHKDPDQIRFLDTSSRFAGGQIAIDGGGEIYAGAGNDSAYCDVYEFSAAERGDVKFDRILELNTTYFGCAVALDQAHLYVESDPSFNAPSTVQEFDKLASGPAKPLTTITLPNGYYGDIRFGR